MVSAMRVRVTSSDTRSNSSTIRIRRDPVSRPGRVTRSRGCSRCCGSAASQPSSSSPVTAGTASSGAGRSRARLRMMASKSLSAAQVKRATIWPAWRADAATRLASEVLPRPRSA